MKNLWHSLVRSGLRDPELVSELTLELQIINSLPEFVADFSKFQEKKETFDRMT